MAQPIDTLSFRAISVGVGGGHVALLAEAMSPLRYVGTRLSGQVGYTNRRVTGRQTDWSLTYYHDTFLANQAVAAGENLTQTGYELAYATLFRLTRKEQRVSLRLGPAARLLGNTRNYPFLPYNRDLDLPVELWARLGPAFRVDYRLIPQLLAHIQVFLPLLSVYGSPSQFTNGTGKADQPRSTGAAGDFLLVSTLNKQPGGRIQTAIDWLRLQRLTRRGHTKLTGQLRYEWDYYSALNYLTRQTGAGLVSLHLWVTI